MIKSDKGKLILAGPELVLGAELMVIIDGIVNLHEKSGVNVCKATFKCASDTGEVPELIKFAELMKQAPEQ